MLVSIFAVVGHFFGKRQLCGDAALVLLILACVEFNTFDEYLFKFLGM